MKKRIKIVAVSYLNTKPLLYGLLHHSRVKSQIDLQLAIPSECARLLKDGAADLGLIPVAALNDLDRPRIVSRYCIGSDGKVETVAIFGDRPIEQLDRILLDFHSRTSVELTRVLLRDHWQLDIPLEAAQPGFEAQIGGSTGALVIGDRTIGLEKKHPFVYDLGAAWKDHTALPFVFAAWVTNRSLPLPFLKDFNQALHQGIDRIPELLLLLPNPQLGFDLNAYLTRSIQYHLDSDKRKGLELFLEKIKSTAAVPSWG